jgi:hypothetical protein
LCCCFRWRKIKEDIFSQVFYLFEDFSSIILDTMVLEIVADLFHVSVHETWKVMSTPLIEPFNLEETECDFTLNVFQDSSHEFLTLFKSIFISSLELVESFSHFSSEFFNDILGVL